VSEDTPLDPLAALRAADPRPRSEQLRAAGAARLEELRPGLTRLVGIGFGVALIVFVTLRVMTPGDPPLEDSLPFAPAEVDDAGGLEAPVTPDPTATQVVSSAIVIHVAGAVVNPGLVIGAEGWRAADAIAAAGGSAGDADLDRLNLASLVTDGQRIYVPAQDELVVPAVVGDSGAGRSESGGPINLNGASESDLDELPGVGPATAAAIVAHREEHGPFGSVDSLVAVSGIGPAKLDSIRDHVVVG